MRLPAGVRDRGGTQLVLCLALAVVVAASVVVSAAGTGPAVLLPLVLLGGGVLAAGGSALGVRRRQEAALLRLRGHHGAGLAVVLAREPLGIAVLGAALGLVPALAAEPEDWLVVAGVWLAATTLVVGAMLTALHAPLTALLDRSPRPRAPGVAGTFIRILVVVAAGVTAARSGADAPEWVAFAGPVLLGLAAGLAAAALAATAGRWLAGRDDLGALLAARRLPTATAGTALVVAAGAVAGLAANTALAHRAWEDDTAAVTVPTPLVIPYDGDAADLLAATQEADPEGRWLMAAVRVLADDRPVSRRIYLDTPRYERVVGDALDGTAAEAGSHAVAELRAAIEDPRGDAAVPLVATPDVAWEDGPRAPTVGGLDRPGRVVASPEVLPVVGSGGILFDLSASLVRDGFTVPAAETWVLARADTPASVLARIGEPAPADDITRAEIATAGTGVTGPLLWIAAGALLLGLLAVLLHSGRQRRLRSGERAALRLLLVPQRTHRRALLLQTGVVAGVAAVTTAAATALAIRLFGAAMPVLEPTRAPRLPLDTGVRPMTLLLPAALVAAVLVGAAVRADRAPERATRPAGLRDEVVT